MSVPPHFSSAGPHEGLQTGPKSIATLGEAYLRKVTISWVGDSSIQIPSSKRCIFFVQERNKRNKQTEADEFGDTKGVPSLKVTMSEPHTSHGRR